MTSKHKLTTNMYHKYTVLKCSLDDGILCLFSGRDVRCYGTRTSNRQPENDGLNA